MGTRFNRDGLVDDVAFDTRGRGQTDLQAAHATDDPAVHDHIIGHALALHRGTFANGQEMGTNIALYGAFDIDIACGLEIACDRQVRRQNRSGWLSFGG